MILIILALGAVIYLIYQIADYFRLLRDLEYLKQEFERRYGRPLGERDGDDHTA